MIASVIACGSSGKDWGAINYDLAIGVNDMYKFGRYPDWLVVVNMPSKFEGQRLRTIQVTHPARFLTHSVRAWKQKSVSNPEYIKNLTGFHQRVTMIRKGFIYTSKTSPIVAMSLAYNAGANEILLWGVDFKDHSKYREGTSAGNKEIAVYRKFIELLDKKGVKTYLGSSGSALEKWIPIYERVVQ